MTRGADESKVAADVGAGDISTQPSPRPQFNVPHGHIHEYTSRQESKSYPGT